MEITVDYDRDQDIVITRPVAEITKENVRLAVKKALEISKRNNCYNLLFDTRKCPVGHTLVEGFLTMRDMKQNIGLSYNYKVAVLYNPSTYPESRANFIETIVSNRANPPFKMFRNKSNAIKWLKEIKQTEIKD